MDILSTVSDDVFSIGMGLNLLKPPSRSVEPARPTTCIGRVVRREVCQQPLRWLSQFPSRRKTKISVCWWFCDCVPFFDGIARYLSWVITMTFLVRR